MIEPDYSLLVEFYNSELISSKGKPLVGIYHNILSKECYYSLIESYRHNYECYEFIYSTGLRSKTIVRLIYTESAHNKITIDFFITLRLLHIEDEDIDEFVNYLNQHIPYKNLWVSYVYNEDNFPIVPLSKQGEYIVLRKMDVLDISSAFEIIRRFIAIETKMPQYYKDFQQKQHLTKVPIEKTNVGISNLDKITIFNFFFCYSRMEYVLREMGFVYNGKSSDFRWFAERFFYGKNNQERFNDLISVLNNYYISLFPENRWSGTDWESREGNLFSNIINLRNNLFHGNKFIHNGTLTGESDMKLIEVSILLIERINYLSKISDDMEFSVFHQLFSEC